MLTINGVGKFLGILGLLALTACTAAQMEAERIREASTTITSASRACFQNLESNPKYGQLKTKLYLSFDDTQYPLQYLTDKSRPTKKEITELQQLHADIQQCRRIAIDGSKTVHPLIAEALAESVAVSDKVWVEAASGQLTWGKFNESRQAATLQAKQKLAEANTRIGVQLQNQYQIEVEQQARATAMMQQWAYQQQYIQAINAPRNINCTNFGITTSCNSF
jgi:hypothetical protein